MSGKDLADKILNSALRNAGMIIAALLVVSAAVLLFSLLGWFFSGPEGFEPPEFEQMRERIETGGTDALTMEYETYQRLKAKKEVREEYGEDIEEIGKERSLGQADRDIILSACADIEPEYRSEYLDGLEDALEEAAEFDEERKEGESKIGSATAIESYTAMFGRAVEVTGGSREEALRKKNQRARRLCGSAAMLVLLIIAASVVLPGAGSGRSD